MKKRNELPLDSRHYECRASPLHGPYTPISGDTIGPERANVVPSAPEFSAERSAEMRGKVIAAQAANAAAAYQDYRRERSAIRAFAVYVAAIVLLLVVVAAVALGMVGR